MKEKYEKELKEIYKKYSFIEEDYDKFVEIALTDIEDELDKDEMKEKAKENIVLYIISMITSSFSTLFFKTVEKIGIAKTFNFYNMIIGESDIEVPAEELIKISKNKTYESFYKKIIEKDKNSSNELLAGVIDIYKDENNLDKDDLDSEYIPNIVSRKHVDDYFREIKGISVLTREQEQELMKKYREAENEEDKKAYRDEFIYHNLRLAAKAACKYYRSNPELKLQLMDLIQEGNLGLVKAFENFDETKGFKFSTYASWWIRQTITRAIHDKNDTIRIPVHMNERILKMSRFVRQYSIEHGTDPSDEQIMEYLDISPVTYKTLKEAVRIKNTSSIDASVDQEEPESSRSSKLAQFLASTEEETIEEAAERKNLSELEFALMDRCLTDREKEVLLLRFGFNENNEKMTLEEVGKIKGVTRERIRQIEAKAIKKLQRKSYYIDKVDTDSYTVILSRKDLINKIEEKGITCIDVLEFRTNQEKSVFKCKNCKKTFAESPIALLSRGTCLLCDSKTEGKTKKKTR